MHDIEWEYPRDHENGVLENPHQGRNFKDSLEHGNLVKLRFDGQFVQVRISDAADPRAIKGEVALSNDSEILESLGLETYQSVLFRDEHIFVRVFGE